MAHTIQLSKKEGVAQGTTAFHFSRPGEFIYVAGQHIELSLPGGGEHIFTIASAPHEGDIMIATRMRKESDYKNTLAELSVGDEVEMDGPWGDLTLHNDADKPAVFLVGGIGVTPARSIIVDSLHNNTGHKLILIASNRAPEDAPFRDEFLKLAESNDNFTLIETMTDANNWDGYSRYIDAAMIKENIEDFNNAVYYIAGPPKMAGAMKVLCDEVGIDDLHVKAEEFSGY